MQVLPVMGEKTRVTDKRQAAARSRSPWRISVRFCSVRPLRWSTTQGQGFAQGSPPTFWRGECLDVLRRWRDGLKSKLSAQDSGGFFYDKEFILLTNRTDPHHLLRTKYWPRKIWLRTKIYTSSLKIVHHDFLEKEILWHFWSQNPKQTEGYQHQELPQVIDLIFFDGPKHNSKNVLPHENREYWYFCLWEKQLKPGIIPTHRRVDALLCVRGGVVVCTNLLWAVVASTLQFQSDELWLW